MSSNFDSQYPGQTTGQTQNLQSNNPYPTGSTKPDPPPRPPYGAAQSHPVQESGYASSGPAYQDTSTATSGTSHVPYDTAGQTTGTTGANEHTYNPDSHHHSTAADTAHHTGDKFHESASGLKGLVAAVHGAGESLRGNINAEIDRLFHDKTGEERNSAIAAAGEDEMASGRFNRLTKNREGVVPGADGERRDQRRF
ncbi:hypothetical protein M430DRAFT_55466 [Amorphotheca resinae ATCC 22711]|uniref:Uncharacterized protein n=1 Tax=Amorphotheca resinae ATCC 22711 TaxID=857342 RepID=A0A2T3BFA5_AMORE|nr:hypothetical protein M430DRAFT_55466 [Amorphotheca resinae ATCC 22711]PSS28059.1 hypothetical protein M430DRAFT_55466 [Amorphotheca resinae ATCC 22711]